MSDATTPPTPPVTHPEDRLAARVMEWTRPVLTVMCVSVFALAFLIAYRNKDAVTVGNLTGTVQAILLIIVGFYFGSSSSSQKKDQTISEAQTALATSMPAKETDIMIAKAIGTKPP